MSSAFNASCFQWNSFENKHLGQLLLLAIEAAEWSIYLLNARKDLRPKTTKKESKYLKLQLKGGQK